MKSASRRTIATPTTPQAPKNKAALALNTTNLMELFSLPMVVEDEKRSIRVNVDLHPSSVSLCVCDALSDVSINSF